MEELANAAKIPAQGRQPRTKNTRDEGEQYLKKAAQARWKYDENKNLEAGLNG